MLMRLRRWLDGGPWYLTVVPIIEERREWGRGGRPIVSRLNVTHYLAVLRAREGSADAA